MRVVVVLEELSKIARKLGRVDAEDSLVRMLASLVTASHEFIGVADLEGNALFVNDAGRDLVGLRDLEAVRGNSRPQFEHKTTLGCFNLEMQASKNLNAV